MRTPEVLDCILAKMTEVGKCQRKFLTELFGLIFSVQGRLTFMNMSRYSHLDESTIRRHYAKFFDWITFNLLVMDQGGLALSGSVIGAMDCSFVPKSGKHTYGLDRFWSGTAGRAKKGLEVSLVALINLSDRSAWSLSVEQTPSGLSATEGKSDQYTRLDHYLTHWRSCLAKLAAVRYFVADGFYAKTKVFEAFDQADKHLITKLRSDANLRLLYQGEHPKGKRGRKRQYDGKVRYDQLDQWKYIGPDNTYPHLQLYTLVANSPRFGKNFRIVLLLHTQLNKYILLACTDLELESQTIVHYYQLRFQIEFLFRDAKQFAGFSHCQARDANKLHFHFNLSLAAINLARLQIKQQPYNLSLNDLIRQAYNQQFLNWILDKLSLKADFDINQPQYHQLIQYGLIHQHP